MIITTKRGRNEKIHIYLDGEYSATTTAKVWFSFGISEKQDISNEEWLSLVEQIYFNKIYESSLDLLSRRDHCRREVYDKLYRKYIIERKGISGSKKEASLDMNSEKREALFDKELVLNQINAVCDRLEELGLISDERYARLYAEELVRVKKMSVPSIKQALFKRGIPKSIVDDTCDSLDHDSIALIKEILSSRYRNRDLQDESQQSKVILALQRKGYTLSEIRQALYEYLEDYISPY